MIPKHIGRYLIVGEIGRGGMATVYLARDPAFQRDVAVKVLPREFLHDATFRLRFQREAQAIAGLEHPAIVPVYDFGEDDGQPYLVMRYMGGGNLEDQLKHHAFTVAEAASLISRVAPALDAAHHRAIVHRDLKPANILFDQHGNPHIADFGLAKITAGAISVTTGAIVGTPAYMSPEQARGAALLDGRADVYSLGVILFEMLTGVTPFNADTAIGLAVKHITDPVPRILKVKPDLPPACEAVITSALAKDPAQRFPSATALAAAIERVAAANAPPPRQPTPEEEAQTVHLPAAALEAALPAAEAPLAPTRPAATASGAVTLAALAATSTQPNRRAAEEPVAGWIWALTGAAALITVASIIIIGWLLLPRPAGIAPPATPPAVTAPGPASPTALLGGSAAANRTATATAAAGAPSHTASASGETGAALTSGQAAGSPSPTAGPTTGTPPPGGSATATAPGPTGTSLATPNTSATPEAAATRTPPAAATASSTPVVTAARTPTTPASATASPPASPTATPPATRTSTSTNPPTPTASATATPTGTPSPTTPPPTATDTPTVTPTPTPTATPLDGSPPAMSLFKAQPKNVRTGKCDVTFSVDLTDPAGVASASMNWTAYDAASNVTGTGSAALVNTSRETWVAAFPVVVPAGGYLEWSVTAADAFGNSATQPSGQRVDSQGGACP